MNDKPSLFLLRGAPGCGKSYFCASNGLEDMVVSSDAIRIELFGIEKDEDGNEFIPQKNGKFVWDTVYDRIENKMRAGENVILDACSVFERDMKKPKELIERYGYDAYIINIGAGVSLEECLKRNREREAFRFVPEDVVERFYDGLSKANIPEFYTVVSPDDALTILRPKKSRKGKVVGALPRKNIGGVDVVGKMPDFSKPVLFLDLDGVVNPSYPRSHKALRGKGWRQKHISVPNNQSEWGGAAGAKPKVTWHPSIIERLNEIGNVLWITNWKGLTQTKINPAIGTDFGYVDWKYRGVSDWGGHGKSHAVAAIAKGAGCPWCVLDDELYRFYGGILEESEIDGMVIAPNHWLGVSEDELAAVEDFMKTGRVPAELNYDSSKDNLFYEPEF